MSNTDGDATLADKAFDVAGKAAKGVASGFKKATNAAADKSEFFEHCLCVQNQCCFWINSNQDNEIWGHCPWCSAYSMLSYRYDHWFDSNEHYYDLYDGLLHVLC